MTGGPPDGSEIELTDEILADAAENGAANGAAGSENGAAHGSSEVHPLDSDEFQDHCVDLLQQGLTRRQFTNELAQLIGESVGSKAVAVLSYNRRKHRLSLMADYALSQEASAALEGGVQYSWDIPIRGLRNRRISVIESAHRNPFVPEPVKAISPDDLAIACIPVYYENLPTAVVLLFNTAERPFTDEDLHALTLGIRLSARGLREGTDIVTAEVDFDAQDELDAHGEAEPVQRIVLAEGEAEELDELRRSLGALQEQRDALAARVERNEEELSRVRIEVERSAHTVRNLTSSRQALAQERDRLKADLEEIDRTRESQLGEMRAEISALEDRLLVAESDRLRHQRAAEQLRGAREQTVLGLERERDSLLERVRTAESGTAAVQGALSAVRDDRDRLSAQIEALTRQLQANQAALEDARGRSEQEIGALASERDGWKEQLATLQMEVARRAEEFRILEHDQRELNAARDAAVDQLRAVREELTQLSGLHNEVLDRAQQAEVAAASARAESDSLREALEAARTEHEHNEAALRTDLESAQAIVERTTQASSSVQARVGELERMLAEREAQVVKLQQERDLAGQDNVSVQSHLAALESEAQRQVAALTAERDGILARAAQAEQSLASESERAQSEARRAASLKERVAQFQESLAQSEAKRAAISAQLAQSQTELEALRSQSSDRGQLAHQVSEQSSKIIEQEKLLAAARDEAKQITQQLAAAERQRAALAKGLQQANRERTQVMATADRDHESLRDSVHQLRAEAQRLERERLEQIEMVQAQRTAHAAALAEAQATMEQLRAERDRAVSERDLHMSSLAAAQSEADARATQALQDTQGLARRLSERERRIDDLADQLRQRDSALERAGEERRNLAESMQAAETALGDLRRELDGLRTEIERQRGEHTETVERIERAHKQELQSAQRTVDDRENRARQASLLALEERRAARYDAPLIIDRSDDTGQMVESTPVVESAVESVRLRIGNGDIVILDRGALCEDAVAVLKGAGVDASGVDPTDAGIDSLAVRSLGAILLNVAPGPQAWQLVRKIRERAATKDVPILAYLMNPEAANGFCFGRCDFGLWPSDLSHLVDTLKRLRPMVRRILVASSDVEALGRVREPLSKAHISASNVLDGKQARELGHSLQPEAAVLHFSPTCSDIARALASFRQIEATRELPLLLMLDTSGSARESIFFQAANRELLRTGRFDFSQLPEELLRLRTPK